MTLYMIACGGLVWPYLTPSQRTQMHAKNYPVWARDDDAQRRSDLGRGARRRARAPLPARGVDRAVHADPDDAGVGRRLPPYRCSSYRTAAFDKEDVARISAKLIACARNLP